MNAIKSRMKSVSTTRQITKAMELVSTSKLRKAKEEAERSRPYHSEMTAALGDALALEGGEESPFVRRREIRNTIVVVIAGDRGLAGGYNSNVFKYVNSLMNDGGGYTIIPIGKKAREYYSSRAADVIDVGYDSVTDVGADGAGDIASLLCREYEKGKIDRAIVVYTRFVSMLTQSVEEDTLLPLDSDSLKSEKKRTAICDISAEELLGGIVPFCLSGIIFAALCESEASEQGARRNAMSAATKNAGEILDSLQLGYNRARQASITQEITEIVSGANAL